MTNSRYLVYKVLRVFGYNPSIRLLKQAADEIQLLNCNMELIGYYNAENTESIAELEPHYKAVVYLKQKIAEYEDATESVQNDHETKPREKALERINDQSMAKDFDDFDLQLRNKKEELNNRRDSILSEARAVRSRYDTLIKKREQFNATNQTEPLSRLQSDINEEASTLRQLKEQKEVVEARISKIDEKLSYYASEKEQFMEEKEDGVTQAYSNQADTNREIASLKNRVYAMQQDLSKEYDYIGRFLFKNSHDAQIRKCIKTHRELLFQATALKKSIALTYQLGDSRVQL